MRRGGARRRARLAALLAAAVIAGCAGRPFGEWWLLSRDPSGQAPDAASTREAILQVYAARAAGWRGVFAVHTWIALKPTDAPAWRRYEVIGWGVERGLSALRVDRTGPDNYWFGARPERLVDLRGDGVDGVIEKVEAAVAAYPYRDSYRTWPGPNSNTFIAYLGRVVPELKLDLPPTAIGKDFLPGGALVGVSPSGHGGQLSLLGVAGLVVGWEGVEVNVLGLTFGLDLHHPALKLPLVGRVGWP